MKPYTEKDLHVFGNSELIALVLELQSKLVKETSPNQLPCHVCGTMIDVDELNENAAYTYPDNKPFCPAHQPDNE